MNNDTLALGHSSRIKSLLSVLLVFALMFGTLALAGCGGSKDEQDNCYGDDMPVINE